ncbi:MAG: GAF domain-containing protein [Spirulina sp. SIO3F2]|nr:GAF domain-containing protein [Spirulina sp. SIO3F2]
MNLDPDRDRFSQLNQKINTLEQRLRSLEQHQRHGQESTLLAQQRALLGILLKILESPELESIFQLTVQDVRHLLGCDRAAIYRLNTEANNQEGCIIAEDVLPGYPSALQIQVEDCCFSVERGEYLRQHYQTGFVWAHHDIHNEEIDDCYRQTLDTFQVRANLVVPLLTADIFWGLLCIHQCSAPRIWQQPEIEFAQQIAVHLGIAIQHAQFVGQLQQQSALLGQSVEQALQREKAVTSIIDKIRRSLNLQTIFDTAVEEVRLLLQSDRAVIYRFNPDWSGQFVAESMAPGWNSLLTIQQTHPQINQNVSLCSLQDLAKAGGITDTYLQNIQGEGLSHGEMYRICSDIYQAGFPDCYIQTLELYQVKAYAIVALYQNQELWGLFAVYQNDSHRQWQPDEIQFLTQIANQLGVGIYQASLLERKSNFLAHMSHELRTPLNSILGFAQILNRDSTLSEQQHEYLRTIVRGGEHLLSLVSDVLEMSKIEAGQMTVNNTQFDLQVLLNNLHEMFQMKAHAQGLRLIFERDKQLPRYIETDESKLRQILINLLSNAIKFTESGHVTLRAQCLTPTKLTAEQRTGVWLVQTARAVPNPNTQPQTPLDPSSPDPGLETISNGLYLSFEIEDSGPGIAPEEQAKLFQPFVQTQVGINSQQGTGLGLVISKQFVELLGGQIFVESQTGHGSTFRFMIQVTAVSAAAQQALANPQQVIGLVVGTPTYRILVVDDRAESRQILVDLLRPIGFEVREATDGKVAYEQWQEWQPHLIWMDMRMPEMDGYAATRLIRSATIGQQPVIIALTATVMEKPQSLAFTAGCNDFVSKPFREDIIFDKLAQHLGLQYVYAQPDLAQNAKSASIPINSSRLGVDSLFHETVQAAIATMSPEWCAEMYRAALGAREQRLLDLIAALPNEQQSVRASLSDAVQALEFEAIAQIFASPT